MASDFLANEGSRPSLDDQRIRAICTKAQWLIVLPALLLTTLLLKPFGAPDETHHFLRAVAVAQGSLLPVSHRAADAPVLSVGANIDTAVQRVVAVGEAREFGRRYDLRDIRILAAIQPSQQRSFVGFNNTAIYFPLAYLPSAAAIAFAHLVSLPVLVWLYLGRIADAVVAFAAGLLAVRYAGSRAPVVIVFNLLPITLQQQASLSADSMVFSSFVVFAALLWRLTQEERLDQRQTLVLASATFVIGVAKIAYFPFSLIAPAVALLRRPRSRSGWILLAAALAATATDLGWAAAMAGKVAAYRPGHVIDPARQIAFVLGNPVTAIQIVVGQALRQLYNMVAQAAGSALGWLDVPIPRSVALLLLANLVGSALLAPMRRSMARLAWRVCALLVATGVICWFAIYSLLYLQYNGVGEAVVDGFQGRYLTPMIVVTVLNLPPLLPKPAAPFRWLALTLGVASAGAGGALVLLAHAGFG